MSDSPWVSLQGADNVRDLGGLPTSNGRRLRHGVLFRGGALCEMTDRDVRVLVEEHKLRTLLDLRVEAEVSKDGRGLLADTPVSYFNLPLKAASMRDDEAVPDLRGRELVSHYLTYLAPSTSSIVEIFHILAGPGALPAMVHCSAGKDRTGVVIALLLTSIGAQEEAVIEEYALSGQVTEQMVARLQRLPSYRGRLHLLPSYALTSSPETMRQFLAEMRRRYGGVRAWLAEAGVTPEVLDRLAEALLEPV